VSSLPLIAFHATHEIDMDPSNTPARYAPLGVMPNFVNPQSIAWVTTFTMAVYIVIVTPFVAARIYTREFVQNGLWWDDGKSSFVRAWPR
jgi:hypothetical protein